MVGKGRIFVKTESHSLGGYGQSHLVPGLAPKDRDVLPWEQGAGRPG